MGYGVVEYDETGKPICEICKRSFNRVLSHVRLTHKLSEREYKIVYGLDLGKGICSLESADKTRQKTLANYDKCIGQNLINKGINNRFAKGDKGRTKDQVSKQTKLMLKERLKQPYMIMAMKVNGNKVGISGVGNIKRWGQK